MTIQRRRSCKVLERKSCLCSWVGLMALMGVLRTGKGGILLPARVEMGQVVLAASSKRLDIDYATARNPSRVIVGFQM